MATPERTQKQTAARYSGHVDYFSRPQIWRVARFIASFVAIVGGIVGIIIYEKLVSAKHASEIFFSSGEISSNHATLQEGCAGCHGQSAGNDLTSAKFRSDLQDRFHHGIDFTLIDRNCQDCHEGKPPFKPKPAFVLPRNYKLHEPNVVEDRTCSICHQEHLGPERMKKVADLHCASCHNDQGVMEASARKGKTLSTLSPDVFHLRPHPDQQIVFPVKRPDRGYTEVFPSFDSGDPKRDHPEFQLVREKASDPDVVRFNHKRHFMPDILALQKNGQKLDCNYCHKADPDGRFYQRISFKANCQECHALLFDSNNPQLEIPHGDVNLVRTFLRTLPAQYGNFARSQGKTDVQSFVAKQVAHLQQQFGSGEQLERAVFFARNPYVPPTSPALSRAKFAGCAVCHDVSTGANSELFVAKPILVDRWMPQARLTTRSTPKWIATNVTTRKRAR